MIISNLNYRNITKEKFKAILFMMIAGRPGSWAFAIPPLILRLKRCNDFDKGVIKHFIMSTEKEIKKNDDYRSYSELMEFQIGLSEILYNSTLPSLKEIKKIEENLIFSIRLSISSRTLKDYWFPTKTDEFYQKFANTRQPFLLLHGTLDPQTPYSHAPYYFKNVKRSPFQYFISFPNYVHVVLRHFHGNCSQQIMVDFVRNPTKKPDISCIDKIPSVDWKGIRDESREISKNLFSIENIWSGL